MRKTIFSHFFFLLSLYFIFFIDESTELNIFFQDFPTIQLGIMTSNFTRDRAFRLYNYLSRESKKGSFFHSFAFISCESITQNQFHFLGNCGWINEMFRTIPSENYSHLEKKRIFDYFELIKFFVINSTDALLFRAQDDIFFNLNALIPLKKRLSSISNPYRDPFVFGQFFPCLNVIQGGSGYLISRQAANFVLSDTFEVIRTITGDIYDDWLESFQLIKVTQNIAGIHSHLFFGHYFMDDDRKRLLTGNFSSLKKCRRRNHYLRDIFFFHEIFISKEFSKINIFEVTKKIPSFLGWDQVCGGSALLCSYDCFF